MGEKVGALSGLGIRVRGLGTVVDQDLGCVRFLGFGDLGSGFVGFAFGISVCIYHMCTLHGIARLGF